jgi:hemerythrin-like domain-containing protein
MKATQQLKDEHEGVKVMLAVLERVCGKLEETRHLDKEYFERILEFLKVFVDKCHHGKEEELLFPALAVAGVPQDGPIRVMLQEHELGRKYIRGMSDAFAGFAAGDPSASGGLVKSGQDYIALLRDHIEKENNVLFAMADRLLTAQMQDELLEGFEKIEEERIGVGKHEEFHHLLEKLSAAYIG